MKRQYSKSSTRDNSHNLPFTQEAINGTIVQRFEQVVQEFPDRIALRSNEKEFTFLELNRRANQTAHALIRVLGAQSEPVPFLLEHDASAIIAILGILKSGKSYVPVDPLYPANWITHILDDIQANIILTNYHNLPLTMTSLANPKVAQIVNLDQLDQNLPIENPNIPISNEDLAYILYTSGSTGLPKGATHNHLDVMHNMFAQSNDLELTSIDRFAVFITFGFEASRFAYFGGLLNGGCVCLYDIRTKGLAGLPGWIESEEITILLSTPSTFRYMLHLVSTGKQFSNVRTIVLGGESATSQDLNLFSKHFTNNCTLVNVLGMTETGIISRMKFDHKTELSGYSLPVGYPIGDKQILIRDEFGAVLPDGEIGEILVRSRYLSPGYWRQADLTAERFLVDNQDPDYRMFRTGDLGRKQVNRCLEHLGRIDSQIKIRGFRVDLAEIEAVIQTFPGVENTAVITRDLPHSPGNKQLVAYVQTAEGEFFTKQDLRTYLNSHLPDYMVPPVIVQLNKLPLTPTGKVNKRELPEPEVVGQEKEYGYLAPRNPIELQLAGIWEKVLKLKPIGVRDDYFELGGNSLLAAQLFSQVEKAFGKNLPLATLFEASTIEKQALILAQDDWVPNWSSLVALRAGGSHPPLFFAAPVGGNVLSYHDLMVHLNLETPCFGLQAVGLDGVQTVHRNVNEIAGHYIQEILTIFPEGPFYLAGSSFGGLVAYEMAQQLHDLGKQVALVVMFDAYGPGYPRRLPGTNRLKRKIFKIARRIDTHFSNLRYTDWQGRIAYFRVKIPRLYLRLQRRLKNRLDQIRHPVPGQLKKIRTAHLGAAKRKKRYMREPRRFEGRLVLFRAQKQPLGIYPDPKLGWGSVVGEALEVHEVAGHHTSIIYEPRVHQVATILNNILKECYTDLD